MSHRLKKNPDAIITSDWHLRDDVPKCRTDDFLQTQANKLKWLKEFQDGIHSNVSIPILCAGDIFDHWKPSPWLLSMCMSNFPRNIYAVPGNHDLPAHNLELLEKAGIWTLHKARKMKILEPFPITIMKDGFDLTGFPFGTKLECVDSERKRKVAIAHVFTYKGRKPFPGATGSVRSVMKKLKGFDLIITGDNHKPFTHYDESTGQRLVNPGCLTRQSAAEADYRPRIYLWYAETNEIKPVYLPTDKDAVSREHLDKERARDDRIDAYVSRLTDEVDMGLDFHENLRQYCIANDVSKPIQTKIREAIDGM